MGRINVLDKHVANMIAAGEVVENPASVIKELVENAIDAGASSIAVEIQNGGITYMRVTDDGCGMSPDDARTAFLRHATSKISNEDDLLSISTLGFRGEALAAIASVSKIDLITKQPESEMGCALRVEAGEILREGESGCPDGTTIIVRELFYNTPARMRFLKKDATEAASVENAVRAAAMSHPEVSIKLIKDGRDVCHTPGDGKLLSCIYSLFGRDFANNMKEVKLSERGISVSGFTCTPLASRGNRGMQFFFVNGRPVRSRMLAAALEAGYKDQLMKGRFPTCVIMLEIPLSQVDVNVHPAKTEVKFAHERDVFDAVYWGVKSSLDAPEKKTFPPVEKIKVDTIAENQQRIEMNTTQKAEEKPQKTVPAYVVTKPVYDAKPVRENYGLRSDLATYDIGVSKKAEDKSSVCAPCEKKEEKLITKEPEAPIAKEEQIKESDIDFRFIGEAMNTYIILERDEKVIFIDKHAAHERVIYGKLIRERGAIQTQLLLTPVVIELDRSAAAVLIENRDEVATLGFEVDEFGDGSVAVSAVPDGIDANDAIPVVEKLAELLSSGARAQNPECLDEVMYSVACRAAVKAGQKNSDEELISLAKRVLMHDDIRSCPHGRPVMFELSKYELERRFKRIV